VGTSDGDLRPYTPGAAFTRIEFEPFNPASPKQRVERLNAAGWKPVNRTKGHVQALRDRKTPKEKLDYYRVYGWTCDEENLSTLPPTAPEAARKLADYLILSSRLGDLDEWIGLYNATSGRIHPSIMPIGSWTHRKAHYAPNSANIPALKNRKGLVQPYGAEFRELWTANPGEVLVGTDADAIQLRVFAHLCDDPKLTEAIEKGKKEEKSDIHSLNLDVLHPICNSRETAKTYIYALLLGAGIKKQAEILQTTAVKALECLERILTFYPGWKRLTEGRLLDEGRRGHFTGLDGRLVLTPSPRHVLAGHLQNGESVIMKKACLLWHTSLKEKGIPFTFLNDVHDEWQTSTPRQYADEVAELQKQAIIVAGQQLNMKIKLAGASKIGLNWKETH
jgi:DNA polymerase I